MPFWIVIRSSSNLPATCSWETNSPCLMMGHSNIYWRNNGKYMPKDSGSSLVFRITYAYEKKNKNKNKII